MSKNPIYYAITKNQYESLKLLLAENESKGYSFEKYFHFAIENNKTDIACYILKNYSSNIDISSSNLDGINILELSVMHQEFDVGNMILDKFYINQEDPSIVTLIFAASVYNAIEENQYTLLELLLAKNESMGYAVAEYFQFAIDSNKMEIASYIMDNYYQEQYFNDTNRKTLNLLKEIDRFDDEILKYCSHYDGLKKAIHSSDYGSDSSEYESSLSGESEY
jgi:ankyrin repeat protein